MSALETLRSSLPDAAKDLKINLQSVLADGRLSVDQRWGVAIASAAATGHSALYEALIEGAQEAGLSAGALDDAKAAAALMGMNNVYYRFRHVIGKESYAQKPAQLRMTRMAKLQSTKLDFELFSLAVSAINACEACMRSHEASVLEHGLTDDHVHDAVRIAATIAGVVTALHL